MTNDKINSEDGVWPLRREGEGHIHNVHAMKLWLFNQPFID